MKPTALRLVRSASPTSAPPSPLPESWGHLSDREIEHITLETPELELEPLQEAPVLSRTYKTARRTRPWLRWAVAPLLWPGYLFIWLISKR